MTEYRIVKKAIEGLATSDGDSVQLTRLIGSLELESLDPFLLFDAFGSDQPRDYIGGFPPHPHRGFETVTYMLHGKMRHKDSVGNEGVIETGGVQWMTAGKGVIHSEMPEQNEGLLSGFQLWVNLPANKKMTAPKYQEFPKGEIPVEIRDDHCRIRVVAGETSRGTKGVIENNTTQPVYWDVTLDQGNEFNEFVEQAFNAFLYVIDGEISVLDHADKILQGDRKHNKKGELLVLSKGKKLRIRANKASQFLLVAGKPINESVVRGGPFVMNTREEIQKAFSDYQSGVLV